MPNGTRPGVNCAEVCNPKQQQNRLILGGTGSAEGSTGQYKMVLDQCSLVLADTLWYWVSMGQFLLVLGVIGSV